MVRVGANMLLLKYISTGLLVVGLFMTRQGDVSLRVEHAQPPVHPVNTLATGLVVTEIEIERVSGRIQTRVLCGEPPFVAAALEALAHWRFIIPSDSDIGRTSVTFLFRPAAIYSVNIGATTTWPWKLDSDYPPLPQQIIDPGYPPTSLTPGAAILELRINASGVVANARSLEGVSPLTDKAQEAVKQWKFSPARISGRTAPATAFVVISFVLPA